MFSIHWKLANALVLAFAFAVAMSATSADAQSTRKQISRSATAGNQYVYSPRAYRARAYYRGPMRRGGINYRDGRAGANWNRNQ